MNRPDSVIATPRARLESRVDGAAGREVGPAGLHLGAAADNDIVLAGEGVAARHASLTWRYGTWQLRVHAGADRVHVNARPVRELALLRLGDTVTIGTHTLQLVPAGEAAAAHGAESPGAWGLRGVAGTLSGRYIGLCPEGLLDADWLPEMRGSLHLFADAGAVRYELLGDAAEVPACNGRAARGGRLSPGDQLTWGRHRFVLEAGLPCRPDAVLPAAGAVAAVEAQGTESARGRGWIELAWLLGAAALLALLITVLLLVRNVHG